MQRLRAEHTSRLERAFYIAVADLNNWLESRTVTPRPEADRCTMKRNRRPVLQDRRRVSVCGSADP